MKAGLTYTAKKLGITPQALLDLVKTEVVPRNKDGSFVFEDVVEAYKKNHHPSYQSKVLHPETFVDHKPKKRAKKVAQPLPPEPEPEQDEEYEENYVFKPKEYITGPDPDDSYRGIKIARERVRLQSETMTLLDLKQNRLVDVAYVLKAHGDMVITAKTRLLSMASELAPEMALETDPAICQAMISRFVKDALAEISSWQPPALLDESKVA